ncbi:Dabb family protein [Streptomyces flaveolus]|uniref:Dabb family protein n=1 Tax=Streptomyces flaveolus TaxID=67297 RepID=UPI0033F471DA
MVTFVLKDGTSDAAIQEVEKALGKLPDLIPELLDYQFGRDLGLNEKNGGFAATAVVAKPEDVFVYLDHPEHVRVSRELLGPHVAHKLAVQFEIDASPRPTAGRTS